MPREEMIEGDDENIVGALTTALMRRGGGGGSQRGGVTAPRFSSSNLANQVGGTNNNKLRAPLGLGSHVFLDNGPFNFIVEPQEAFRGERLIVDVVAAAGLLLSIDEILVGSLPQAPSTEFGLPSDAVVLATEWNEFRALNFARLKKEMKSPVIVDLRNVYDPVRMEKEGFRYSCFGRANVMRRQTSKAVR